VTDGVIQIEGATGLQTAETIGEMYREAWSRFATGVTVITTVEPNGSVHGMTASSVTSVSLDPPLVLVVVGESRQSHGLIESTGRFGMSILDTGQIANAIAAMNCKVSAAHKAGDHTVFIGEVEAIDVGEGDPLVWFQRQFGGFADKNSDNGSE
jgi:flavin reductase (DIM6/NTAB) family NADH-FMN oxidoreductase RutF